MDIFKYVNDKCSHESTAELIQTLNKYRLLLTGCFTNQTQHMTYEMVLKILIDLQIDVERRQYQFDLEKIQSQNLLNLMKLLKNIPQKNKSNKKFNVDWNAIMEKRKAKLQPGKKTESFQDINKNKLQQTQITTFASRKGLFFQNERQQKPKSSNFENNRQQSKFQYINNQKGSQKSSNVQFVSASILPKSVSVRKKFVPPFKKAPTQSIKQQTNEEGDDEKCKDPLYKGLQKKLVDTIECEILQTRKSVKWQQIAGLDFAKKLINQMIVWPMLRPDIFTGMRAPPRGILLFGPPGTGKTMIGRAIASSANATFFNISASSLTSKWVGQSQKLVRTLFQIARIKQPSVIFIDEIDSLLCSRSQGEQESSRRVKTEFLVELDGTKTSDNERILIIGATNLPQQLDDAVRRRFIKRLYIPLPNHHSRAQLLQTLTSNPTFNLTSPDINQLSQLTKGFSGADIHSLCKQASMIPLRQIRQIQTIRFSEVPVGRIKHFKQALRFVRPSVNKKGLEKYEDWNQQYGSYQFNPDQLEN